MTGETQQCDQSTIIHAFSGKQNSTQHKGTERRGGNTRDYFYIEMLEIMLEINKWYAVSTVEPGDQCTQDKLGTTAPLKYSLEQTWGQSHTPGQSWCQAQAPGWT